MAEHALCKAEVGGSKPSHSSKTFRKPAFIEIQARPLGRIQWICPNCTHFNANTHGMIDWRSGRVDCSRCRRVFTVGIAFFSAQQDVPPYNGFYCDIPAGWTTHLVDHFPLGRFNSGRIVGSLAWICPNRHLSKVQIDWDTGKISCPKCDSCYYVSLILYRLKCRSRRTPLDWVLPIWDTDDVQISAESSPH